MSLLRPARKGLKKRHRLGPETVFGHCREEGFQGPDFDSVLCLQFLFAEMPKRSTRSRSKSFSNSTGNSGNIARTVARPANRFLPAVFNCRALDPIITKRRRSASI